MSGIYKQHFVPADPPAQGRYVVWRKGRPDWDWDAAILTADGEWRHPESSGPMHDVHWYMDVGGEADRPRGKDGAR